MRFILAVVNFRGPRSPMAEARSSNLRQCRFESDRGHIRLDLHNCSSDSVCFVDAIHHRARHCYHGSEYFRFGSDESRGPLHCARASGTPPRVVRGPPRRSGVDRRDQQAGAGSRGPLDDHRVSGARPLRQLTRSDYRVRQLATLTSEPQ